MEFINKNQSIQTPIQLITKILLPFSLLSAILSYPILCNFKSLAYGLEIFSFSVGKNYMFLLCNGLLVFIARTSGLIGSSSVESDIKVEKTLKNSKGELEVESSDPKRSVLKEKVIIAQVPLVVVEDEDRTNELVAVDEDEEIGLMSNEELNKKCEDFIRKMKQGIKIETRNS